jgi:hypothetical protein
MNRNVAATRAYRPLERPTERTEGRVVRNRVLLTGTSRSDLDDFGVSDVFTPLTSRSELVSININRAPGRFAPYHPSPHHQLQRTIPV